LKTDSAPSEWIPLRTNSTHCDELPLLQIPRLLKRKRHLRHTPIVVIRPTACIPIGTSLFEYAHGTGADGFPAAVM